MVGDRYQEESMLCFPLRTIESQNCQTYLANGFIKGAGQRSGWRGVRVDQQRTNGSPVTDV